MAGVAEWFRRWAADPLYMGSIPIPGSKIASTENVIGTNVLPFVHEEKK